jgi:hypothetical protein
LTQGIFMYIMLLLNHAWIQDDLTTLISNWKLLDNLCNKYSKGTCLDIKSHPQSGTASNSIDEQYVNCCIDCHSQQTWKFGRYQTLHK